MSKLSLASFKKKFGITDDADIKFEKKDNEFTLHIPIRAQYKIQEESINTTKNLVSDGKAPGWTSEKFILDFIKFPEKNISKTFSTEEIQETIQDSFKRELEISEFKLDRYIRSCKNFEIKYSMTSDDFFSRFEGGKLDEEDDYFDWYSAYRAVQIWSRKYQILLEFSQ